jgi:DNA-3-methyladenine glycosylase
VSPPSRRRFGEARPVFARTSSLPRGGTALPALPREFYARPTLDVARDLIGKVLVHETPAGITAGVIVETEAYIGESDPACHAAPGPTRRNAPLYGPPGIAYVYLNYGIHYLVNAVTEPDGWPAAVLIRALEPVEGEGLMRRRRARGTERGPGDFESAALCRGPGNLTRALGISLQQNLRDLVASDLRIEDAGLPSREVVTSPRIGITVGTDRPWRFHAEGSPAVSRRAAEALPAPRGPSPSRGVRRAGS